MYCGVSFNPKKQKEILTHVKPSGMNLEDNMLSEVRQTQKINTVWSHLHVFSTVVKLIETENRMVVTRAGEGRYGGMLFDGHRGSVLQDEKILEISYPTVGMYLT